LLKPASSFFVTLYNSSTHTTHTQPHQKKTLKRYVGLRRRRERGPAYDALVEEFVVGAQQAFGENVLLQFEDFGNSNAFR
jgi:hypothetical protein